jgi:hypothetical protein
MPDEILVPRFKQRQLVRISLHDHKGKVKNELARRALPYYAQVAEVLSVSIYEKGKNAVLVYRVNVEDGTIIEVTED